MSMRDLYLGAKLRFDSDEERHDSEDFLVRVLGLNSKLNLQYLRRNPDTPLLYDSGVRYTDPDQLTDRSRVTAARKLKLVRLARDMGLSPEEAMMQLRVAEGMEIFLDIPSLLLRGKGDCNELVPWRVAECWRSGIYASPYLAKGEQNDRGGFTYHAVVWYPQEDEIECPSSILGMHGRVHRDVRREEINKNFQRHAAYSSVIGQAAAHAAGFVPTSGVFASPYDEVRAVVGRRAA